MRQLLFRLSKLRKQSLEAGIATIEYVATALVASMLIGVMVTVPVAAESSARDGFKNAICKVFEVGGIGGGCSNENNKAENQEQTSASDPNDQPPVCAVNKTSEKNAVKADFKVVTAEGEFIIRKTVMSDEKISYTVVGGIGGGAEIGTPPVGADAEVNVNAKINVGDTWIYDPKSDEGKSMTSDQFEKLIRDYAGWNVADKVTMGLASGMGKFFVPVPPEPRAPDSTSGELSVGADGSVKVGETLDLPDGAEIGAEAKAGVKAGGTVGMSVNNKDHSTTYTFSIDVGAEAKASTSMEAGDAKLKAESGVTAGAKDTVSPTYDKDGKLTKIKIEQAREFNAKTTVDGKLPNGVKMKLGDDGKLYTVTTAEMDLANMSDDQRQLAEEWLHSGMIAPDLGEAMDSGLPERAGFLPVHDEFADLLWKNSKIGRNIYLSKGDNAGLGGDTADEKFGISLEQSFTNDQLISSEYALPADGNDVREIVENATCLK